MKYRILMATLLAVCLGMFSLSTPAFAAKQTLTYDDIIGTGLANKCPTLDDTARGAYPIDSSQTYRITRLCLQPTTFFSQGRAEEQNAKRPNLFQQSW